MSPPSRFSSFVRAAMELHLHECVVPLCVYFYRVRLHTCSLGAMACVGPLRSPRIVQRRAYKEIVLDCVTDDSQAQAGRSSSGEAGAAVLFQRQQKTQPTVKHTMLDDVCEVLVLRLKSRERRALGQALSTCRAGTACSGTDSPVLALGSLHAATSKVCEHGSDSVLPGVTFFSASAIRASRTSLPKCSTSRTFSWM